METYYHIITISRIKSSLLIESGFMGNWDAVSAWGRNIYSSFHQSFPKIGCKLCVLTNCTIIGKLQGKYAVESN